MSPLLTGPEFALIVCLGIVVLCLIVLMARRWSQMPSFPPLYDDSDILPDPEWRARVPRVDPNSEWIIEP